MIYITTILGHFAGISFCSPQAASWLTCMVGMVSVSVSEQKIGILRLSTPVCFPSQLHHFCHQAARSLPVLWPHISWKQQLALNLACMVGGWSQFHSPIAVMMFWKITVSFQIGQANIKLTNHQPPNHESTIGPAVFCCNCNRLRLPCASLRELHSGKLT